MINGLDQSPNLSTALPKQVDRWLKQLFPIHVSKPFSKRHIALLRWVEAIQLGERYRPYIAIWPRGGGKSSLAELTTVFLAAENRRKYGVYVRRTQEKADESVSNIGTLLESRAIGLHYPTLGARKAGKYGNKDWRRQRLWAANGFAVDALGMDSAFRSAKIEERRPDFFVFDDLDDPFDSPKSVQKMIDTITKSILPAGDSSSLTVLGIQNLIRKDGFFGRMVNGQADYLGDRLLDGPYPAIENFEYEQRIDPDTGLLRWYITGGQSTWAGQDLEVCQRQITDWGLLPFRQEAQHEVELLQGGLYSGFKFTNILQSAVPPLLNIQVWVDPAVTSTVNSNCQGIQVDGIDKEKRLYRLRSWEGVLSPEEAIKKAILWAIEYKASAVGIETDQGGDVWALTYSNTFKNMLDKGEIPKTAPKPQFKSAKAGSVGGKVERQNMMRSDYDSGGIIHVIGTHTLLENALQRFPIFEPYDLADAAFWGWYHLRHRGAWTR